MKIAYVHTAPVPSPAANAVQVARMCAAFSAEGVETCLVQPWGGGGDAGEIASEYGLDTQFETRKLPLLSVPGSKFLYGALASLLYGPGREGVVYTRSVSVAAAACMLCQPVALEMHVSAASLRPRLAKRLECVIDSPYFVGMIAISGRLRDDFEKRYPALDGQIIVAHDGAESAAEVPAEPLSGRFRVGYVGNLYPGKGMELIAELVPLCPWATFHIVGGAPDQVKVWRSALANNRNIVFHGYVRHAETAAYLEGMEVVLAPYQRVVRGVGGGSQNLADWMSPLKIFEYMACGRAIIASDLEVLHEVLTHNQNALLCLPEEPAAWVVALKRLRDEEVFRSRIGLRAREDFQLNYTWEQRSRTILKMIDKV
ncbi:glycosyltransferase family 4 protein [Parvibaculum sp.]|uniref:glycosyltransferase family 4 protein n=1 Tax=Parvibaculum sp. TaxID=2024848 RepID=UPI000C91C893|nr:glycosyltransferase family 4 protein [Parvibaculum sp.]MAB15386.1 hypothetical protein [Parvibaculum sp.]